jgi:hypothetical protein
VTGANHNCFVYLQLTEEIEVSDSEEDIEGDVNDGEDSGSGLEPVDEDVRFLTSPMSCLSSVLSLSV